jgi:hypothetical protein
MLRLDGANKSERERTSQPQRVNDHNSHEWANLCSGITNAAGWNIHISPATYSQLRLSRSPGPIHDSMPNTHVESFPRARGPGPTAIDPPHLQRARHFATARRRLNTSTLTPDARPLASPIQHRPSTDRSCVCGLLLVRNRTGQNRTSSI